VDCLFIGRKSEEEQDGWSQQITSEIMGGLLQCDVESAMARRLVMRGSYGWQLCHTAIRKSAACNAWDEDRTEVFTYE
jgi:hypothetical protein